MTTKRKRDGGEFFSQDSVKQKKKKYFPNIEKTIKQTESCNVDSFTVNKHKNCNRQKNSASQNANTEPGTLESNSNSVNRTWTKKNKALNKQKSSSVQIKNNILHNKRNAVSTVASPPLKHSDLDRGQVTSQKPEVSGHAGSNNQSTGKKRRKNFKKNKVEKKPKPESVKTVAEQSTKSTCSVSFSSNWKALQQILSKEKKPTYHRRPKVPKPQDGNLGEDKTNEETDTKPQIWFDDVDDILIETMKKKEQKTLAGRGKTKTDGKSDEKLVKTGSFQGLTRAVAMDCEMVGVGEGGRESVLARVSIVNHFGQSVYDKYVKARETVTDYRTHVSGIRPQDIQHGLDFTEVQKEVSDLLKDRLLIGHAIDNDLKVLFLDHPRRKIRDTSVYKPFRELFCGRKPSLKKLSQKVLMIQVQEGEHNSVQDAQAAMRLYTTYRKQWEQDLRLKRKDRPQSAKKKILKPSSLTIT